MKPLFRIFASSSISSLLLLASCGEPEVKEVAVARFSINPTEFEIKAGDTLRIQMTFEPSNATNLDVVWRSYNTSVATVDETGLVSGVSIGETQIAATCKSNGQMRFCSVTVIPSKEYTDLSAAECANCYIVSSPGAYKFATNKGNGYTSVGRVDYAGLLWETYGTFKEIEAGTIIKDSLMILGDYILFETPDTLVAGNAVIAAYDNADNILWSWHIWVPADSIKTHSYAGGGGSMMDRNLGALTCTPGLGTTNGFYYQWGRKDPFPGPPDVLTSNSKQTRTSALWPEAVDAAVNPSTYTIEYTVRNPMVRIAKITDMPANGDWLYNNGLAESDNTRWKNTEKTIYDPCPAGWRIPTRTTLPDPLLYLASDTELGFGDNFVVDLAKTNGCTLDITTNAGWSIGGSFCDGGDDWYPLQAFSNNGVSKTFNAGTVYWTAFSQNTGNMMGSCYQYKDGKLYVKGTINKLYYGVVRCCRED